MINTKSQIKIQVGKSGTFGASVSMVNAFDKLCHLMEIMEGNKARFDEMQYSDLVLLVKRVDQAVISLLALDAWSNKTMALQLAKCGTTSSSCVTRLLLP